MLAKMLPVDWGTRNNTNININKLVFTKCMSNDFIAKGETYCPPTKAKKILFLLKETLIETLAFDV